MTPRSATSTPPLQARRASAGLLLAAGLLLTACSAADEKAVPTAAEPSTTTAPTAAASASPSASPSATTSAAATVRMIDFEYEVPASVPAGAQVVVVNDDAEAHTFTLKGGPEVRLIVPPRGASLSFTAPTQPGTYEVVCEFHGGMTTSLVVV